MKEIRNIVVIQTAFIGDAILTLPLVQAAKKAFPSANIDLVVTPRSKELFSNHPDVHEAIGYDKRGADSGPGGLLRMARQLKSRSYDLALIPHRSLRSALLAFLSGVTLRIGFDRSAGRFLMSRTVRYNPDIHEIDRNLSLLNPLTPGSAKRELPRIYPSDADERKVDKLLIELEIGHADKLVAIAPGTIWSTKRWLKERFGALAVRLESAGWEVVLVGGSDDKRLCSEIRTLTKSSLVYDASGALTLLQSAELIRRCRVLICNDSAPMHLATAVGTPVIAIFGATVPSFGFGPTGPYDVVVETEGLKCRPCSIHGGDKCPIQTFDCMRNITDARVFEIAINVISTAPASRGSVH
jgi:heptosyltransferase II